MSEYELVREGSVHVCRGPVHNGDPGEIRKCSECGQHWEFGVMWMWEPCMSPRWKDLILRGLWGAAVVLAGYLVLSGVLG